MPEHLPEPWLVHDHPHRPLSWGAHFCGCSTCDAALEEVADERPDLPVVVKFAIARRLVISAARLTEEPFDGEALVARFSEADDWVRDLYVARSFDDGDSTVELHVLALLREAGLPEPERHVVVHADGSWEVDDALRVER